MVTSGKPRHTGCNDLGPEATKTMNDAKINGIIRNQKRLMIYNLLVSGLLGCGLVASALWLM
jgi:hypothetical protein